MPLAILLLGLILQPLPPQGGFAILGSVRVSGGGAAGGALRVSLLNDNYQTIRTILVDASGRFQFRGLGQGVYLVKVESTSSEFEEQTQRVEFQGTGRPRTGAEEIFPVDFVLRRKKAPAQPEAPGTVFAQTVPEAARAEYERGLKKVKENKSAEAFPALKKAIEIFPDYYLALELLGTEYVKAGNLSEAVPLLTRAVGLNEAAPKSLYALGVATLKLKQTSDAIGWLQKAVAQDGKNVNAHLMLGIALGTVGRLDEAEASLRRAYRLGGEQVADVHMYLAGIYDKQKKYDEAVRELELLLKEGKDLDESKVKAMIARLRSKAEAEQKTP